MIGSLLRQQHTNAIEAVDFGPLIRINKSHRKWNLKTYVHSILKIQP